MKTQMRSLFAVTLLALAATNSWSQVSPLKELTITSTRLSCSSGFTEVTYAYKRDSKNANASRLEFIVIQTSKHHMFKSCVHLSSKVDDVTPPVYIALDDWAIDLPDDDQIHAVFDGRYRTADSDLTLGEIRAWLDQPPLRCSIESLVDYRTKSRAAEPEVANRKIRWSLDSPKKIAWSSNGSANFLGDHSIELQGSSGWHEFTLYFHPQGLPEIDGVLLEVLPCERSSAGRNQKTVLFDIKPHLESVENGITPLEFRSCRFLGNEADETAANCIDFLSDTGWTVPDFDGKDACHQLVLELSKPITVGHDNLFAVTIDSGGAPDLKPLSRIRVSFSCRNQGGE